MKKIIPILMMILMSAVAFASLQVNLDPQGLLANNTYKTSSTVYPNFNVTGNWTTYTCKLWTNESGSSGLSTYQEVQTMSSVANNTNTNFSARTNVAEIVGKNYKWDVNCTGTGTTTSNLSKKGIYNYGMDLTSPSITINSPSNAGWDTDGDVTWNLTVIDNNPDKCKLVTLLNITTNTTSLWVIKETMSFTNSTWFNFTFGQATANWANNNTGAYLWYVTCNDSAAQSTTGGNYTFYVDKTAPTAPDFNTSNWKTDNRYLWNATTATDFTPQVAWNYSTESNFSRYEICYYNDSYSDTSTDCVNVTNQSIVTTDDVILIGDEDYMILIKSYDVAGNYANMTTKDYKYSTDSTGRELKSGWNIITNIGNSFNLSSLRGWLSATTVSLWNSTHQFQSHVSGGSYGDVSASAGTPVYVYVSADTNFSDMIWNTTALPQYINITNTSSSDWNLVANLNWTASYTFQQLDNYLNVCNVPQNCTQANVTFLDKYTNTAAIGSKLTPFKTNWSFNNATSLSFGEPCWMLFSTSTLKNQSINWRAIP